MIFPILGRSILLSLRHPEERRLPWRGSLSKQAATRTPLQNKKKKKEDKAVPVRYQISRRQRQVNKVHRNEGSLVKTTRETSEG